MEADRRFFKSKERFSKYEHLYLLTQPVLAEHNKLYAYIDGDILYFMWSYFVR